MREVCYLLLVAYYPLTYLYIFYFAIFMLREKTVNIGCFQIANRDFASIGYTYSTKKVTVYSRAYKLWKRGAPSAVKLWNSDYTIQCNSFISGAGERVLCLFFLSEPGL